MKQIADLVLEQPDLLRYRSLISKGIECARARFLDHLAQGVIVSLGEGYTARLRGDMVSGGFGEDEYGDLIIAPAPGSPLQHAPFEIWLEHISKWEALVIGVVVRDGKRGLPEKAMALFVRMNAIMDREFSAQGLHRSSLKDTWAAAHWPTGWHDILPHPSMGDEKLADMMQDPEAAIAVICKGAMRYLHLLEAIYQEAITPEPVAEERNNPVS